MDKQIKLKRLIADFNVVVDDGIQAVIDKVNELESIIDKIEIISFED